MTRFWITLDQGVDFVLSSLAMMQRRRDLRAEDPLDAASSISPAPWRRSLPHKIVGIRPGEKLHEVMITEDDARMTVELDDRYVICPPFRTGRREHLDQLGAGRSRDGFRYASDSNAEWLDARGLTQLIEAQGGMMPAFLPYGRQTIDDDDIAAVAAGAARRLADHRPAGRGVRGAFAAATGAAARGRLQQRHRGAASGGAGRWVSAPATPPSCRRSPSSRPPMPSA